ncbi:hypothetical protein, partial [Mangrovimonas futianensis]|uniref:hypothetical protein n=1 Tax=Mangrovimonas futianensis TaxID=2895523 RepID=UPI001E36C382
PDLRFEGEGDPRDHLDAFNDLMELHQVSDLARCRCFAVTLTGDAKMWYKRLRATNQLMAPVLLAFSPTIPSEEIVRNTA